MLFKEILIFRFLLLPNKKFKMCFYYFFKKTNNFICFKIKCNPINKNMFLL